MERASFEFWESLANSPDAMPCLADRRSWERVRARAGIGDVVPLRRPLVRKLVPVAASILVPLMAVAGGLMWYSEMRQRAAESGVQEAAIETQAHSEPLIFSGATAAEIFAALERHFDAEITAAESLMVNAELYTVKFQRADSLDAVLGVLQEMIGFDYKISDNKILISTHE
jgi:hypothetical protein